MPRSSTIRLFLAAIAVVGGACSPPDAAQRTAAPVSTEQTVASPAAASPGDGSCGEDACGASEEACGEGSTPAPAEPAALRKVASEEVCMRSNRFMGKRQLSANVDGHTYFGCCAGCNKHLSENAAARTAKDPVTGNVVDKASAVIGARPDGSVVYFESQETFARAGGA